MVADIGVTCVLERMRSISRRHVGLVFLLLLAGTLTPSCHGDGIVARPQLTYTRYRLAVCTIAASKEVVVSVDGTY